MMTNCRFSTLSLRSIFRALSLTVILGTILINSQDSVGKTLLQTSKTQYTDTPDPYFQGSPKSLLGTSNAPIKPIRVADRRPARIDQPALWTPPKTIANPHVDNRKDQQNSAETTVSWETPITNVRTNSANKSKLQPITPANSIIRERSNSHGSNDFSIGSGSPTTPMTSVSRAGKSESTNPDHAQLRGLGIQTPTIDDNQFGSPAKQPNFAATQRNSQSIFNDSNAFGAASKSELQRNNVSYNRQPSTSTVDTTKAIPLAPPKHKMNSENHQAFEPGKVLALVGGEPIFVGDLMFEINQVIEQFIGGAPDKIKAKRRQEMIPQVLPKYVESKILYLGSIRMLPEGADVKGVLKQAEDEFDESQLEKVLKNSGLKSSSEFDAYLRLQGSSIRKMRRSWAQEQLTKYFLSRALSTNTEVTHQDMLDGYRESIDTYAQPAKAKWEQIMVRFDRSTSRGEAKQKLIKLGDEVVYGANLAAVAKKESHGFLASQGGQHDWTTKGALVLSEIDEAIFSQPIGELSDIIETQDGYHIVRVIERNEATTTPFLDAQVEIKKRILDEKRKKAFDDYVKKLKREIPVEYYLNEDAKDPIGNAG